MIFPGGVYRRWCRSADILHGCGIPGQGSVPKCGESSPTKWIVFLVFYLPQKTRNIAADLGNGEKGRRAASRLGDRLGLRLWRHSQSPVDPRVLAQQEGVEIVKAVTLRGSGRIGWTSSGLRIALNENEGRRRQRFTLAHELAHHLIFGIDEGEARTYSREEERRCDRFATALLMPTQAFAEALKERASHSLASAAIDLSEQFDVSLQSTVWRLDELELVDAATILLMFRADAVGDLVVREAAYDKSTYRSLKQSTARDLGMEEAIAEMMSMQPGSRSIAGSVRLPTKRRGVPRDYYSYLPAVMSCVVLRGIRRQLLAEINLVSDPLRPRMLKQPSWRQERLLRES